MKKTIRNLVAVVGLGFGLADAQALNVFSNDFSSFSTSLWTTNSNQGTITHNSSLGRMEIVADQNRFATIRTDLGDSEGLEYIQADIQSVDDSGSTWGPSLNLYFDNGPVYRLGYRGGNLAATLINVSNLKTTNLLSYAAWYTFRIAVDTNASLVRFSVGPQGGPLTYYPLLDQPLLSSATGNVWLILGKGAFDTNPYLDNDYSGGLVANMTSYYDNVIVVPEPGTMLLLGLAALAAVIRRRR